MTLKNGYSDCDLAGKQVAVEASALNLDECEKENNHVIHVRFYVIHVITFNLVIILPMYFSVLKKSIFC